MSKNHESIQPEVEKQQSNKPRAKELSKEQLEANRKIARVIKACIVCIGATCAALTTITALAMGFD